MPKQPVSRAVFSRARRARFRLLAVAFLTAVLTLTAWAWITTAGKGEPTPSSGGAVIITAPVRSLPTQDRIEAETITLSPTGFEPAEIRRPAGRFLLAVNDLSGLDETAIRLESEGGQVLHEAMLGRRQQKWRKVVDLTAGAYVLTVAGSPEWRCQIFIY